MTTVYPFYAYKYNSKKVTIEDVVSQPYDKISTTDWEMYGQKNTYNIVNLILNKKRATDSPSNNRYTRANELLKRWVKDGIIKRNEHPCFYLYDQVYTYENTTLKRKGFTALIRLKDFSTGHIKPHEYTLSNPKKDRFNLLKETQSLFGHIFMLYDDKKDSINNLCNSYREKKPDIEVRDSDTNIHQIWEVNNLPLIQSLKNSIAGSPLLIADGHHRYETYLDYLSFLKNNNHTISADADCNFALVTLVNLYDEGLTILPTHRVIKQMSCSPDKLLQLLNNDFNCEKIDIAHETDLKNITDILQNKGKDNIVFGFYKGGTSLYIVTYKLSSIPEKNLSMKKGSAWRSLDLSVLHTQVLEKLCGITEDVLREGKHVSYAREAKKAFGMVNSGEARCLFLVNPTKISSVLSVTQEGDRMPQKSTDFYPKLLTGLTFYKMENFE
ncbi:DUF1015 domain-containing protein [Chlamydiota bacterium]